MSLFDRVNEQPLTEGLNLKPGSTLIAAAEDLEKGAKELRALAKRYAKYDYEMLPLTPYSPLYIVKRAGKVIHNTRHMNGVEAARQIAYDAKHTDPAIFGQKRI